MLVAGGKGRSLEVMDGSGWPLVANKMVEKWPSHPAARNKVGTGLGHFGAFFGGCGGYPWLWRCWGILREALKFATPSSTFAIISFCGIVKKWH